MKHTLRFQLSGQVSITLNLSELLCVCVLKTLSETDMENCPENADYFPGIILISLILLSGPVILIFSFAFIDWHALRSGLAL